MFLTSARYRAHILEIKKQIAYRIRYTCIHLALGVLQLPYTVCSKYRIAGHGMEWNGKWNGTEILVWNMEDARMEWNGRFQEWNERQSFILPYQFHSRFRA